MKTIIADEYFEQALFELLKKKDYTKISITELCHKAGIGRTSFYRYYSSLNDVVSKYLTRTFSFDNNTFVIKDRLEELFSIVYEQKEQLLLLNKNNLLNGLFSYVYKTTLSHIEGMFNNRSEYVSSFYAGAASAFILSWIDSGMKEKPEELSGIFYSSLKGLMYLE